jgi:hypothetical protein
MSDIIDLEEERSWRARDGDERWVAEYEAQIDYLRGQILGLCEASGHRDTTMLMEAILLVAATLAARGCPQYREGWVAWVAQVLPYMLRQEVGRIRAGGDTTCLTCTGDAICDAGETRSTGG